MSLFREQALGIPTGRETDRERERERERERKREERKREREKGYIVYVHTHIFCTKDVSPRIDFGAKSTHLDSMQKILARFPTVDNCMLNCHSVSKSHFSAIKKTFQSCGRAGVVNEILSPD